MQLTVRDSLSRQSLQTGNVRTHRPDYSHEVTYHAPWIVPFERNPRFTGRESQLTKLDEKLSSQGQTAARFWLPDVQTVGPISGQSKLRLLSSGEIISIGTLFQLSMRRVTPQIDSPVILIQSSMPGLTLY